MSILGRLGLFFFGAIGTFAWAPFYHPEVLALSLSFLMLQLFRSETVRQGFWNGWFWGWGLFVGSLFWVSESLFVDPSRFLWIWPFSTFGLPAFLALYIGIPSALSVWVRGKDLMRPRAGAFCLTFFITMSVFEGIRGSVLTGFPWNLWAYVWGNMLPIAQSASFIGSYGLGLITLILMGLPVWGFLAFSQSPWRGGLIGLGVGLTGLGSLYFFGHHILHTSPTALDKSCVVRIIQPNFSQKEKENASFFATHLDKLLSLSSMPSSMRSDSGKLLEPTYVIWPESSLPWMLTPATQSTTASLLAIPKKSIVTGCVFRGAKKLWNSLYFVRPRPSKPIRRNILKELLHTDISEFNILREIPELDVSNSSLFKDILPPHTAKNYSKVLYHKVHLLPFGEYVPFQESLRLLFPEKWLRRLTPGTIGFSKGKEHRTIELEGLPSFSPLICYEVVFPGNVTAKNAPRPQWLLNITNDAWFGVTHGPHQHFASAQFRAIEEGLALVRVANTGISGVVDGKGRILNSIGLEQQGILDFYLPQPFEETFFTRHHHLPWIFFLTFLSLLTLLWRCRKNASSCRNHYAFLFCETSYSLKTLPEVLWKWKSVRQEKGSALHEIKANNS